MLQDAKEFQGISIYVGNLFYSGQSCSESVTGKKKPVGAIVAVVLLLIIGGALIIGVVYVKKTGKPEKIYHL